MINLNVYFHNKKILFNCQIEFVSFAFLFNLIKPFKTKIFYISSCKNKHYLDLNKSFTLSPSLSIFVLVQIRIYKYAIIRITVSIYTKSIICSLFSSLFRALKIHE